MTEKHHSTPEPALNESNHKEDDEKKEESSPSSLTTVATSTTTTTTITSPATTSSNHNAWRLRLVLLGVLAIQTATHTLLVRYSRGVLHERFNPAAVVLIVELLKVSACSIAISFFPSASSPNVVTGPHRIPKLIFDTPPMILIPATSFFIQNILAFVALKYLQPSVFIVLSQLKIVATTIFSTLILKRKFTQGHWRSLVLLIFATILVDPSSKPTTAAAATTLASSAIQAANTASIGGAMIGVIAVLCMAALSGFSSVILELVLKGTPSVTIWERNLQLATSSIVLAMLTVSFNGAFNDFYLIATFNSGVTLCAAIASAFGGILVASVMRYADNVVKCFATAVGICLTSTLSVLLFGENASRLLLIGIGLVILSILNYNAEPPAQSAPLSSSPTPTSSQATPSSSSITVTAVNQPLSTNSTSWKYGYILSLGLGFAASLVWGIVH